jgi:hypothetical protein
MKTDLELLLAADEAAHRFFEAVTRGVQTLDEANDAALGAYNGLHACWDEYDLEQRPMFRYHFAMKLIALGLVRPASVRV